MIRDLAFDEDKSQTDELHFEKQQLYKRHVVTRCRNGYELYEKLFCGSISHFLSLCMSLLVEIQRFHCDVIEYSANTLLCAG